MNIREVTDYYDSAQDICKITQIEVTSWYAYVYRSTIPLRVQVLLQIDSMGFLQAEWPDDWGNVEDFIDTRSN